MTDLDRLTEALSDRYTIEHELGTGGMATVYLAHDVKHDRKVAVKVLRPELAAVIGAERFLSEIKTTANLQHPHILPLHDSGEADSFLYYVMPYIEGESLRDRLDREKQLPVDDAVRLASQIASALDYAHRHEVIHRDIKPENILLHDGAALVADFGIALAASKAGGTRMTETGMSLGTPHYMSPEQAMGDRELTAKSDVYALGATLYEMLSGEPPFSGPTAQAIVAKVMTDDPRPLTELRRSVPPHVDAACLRALEKLPADRFASAAEFSQALHDTSFTLGRTSAGASAAAASVPGAWWRDWRPWAVTTVLLAVVALLGRSGGATDVPDPLVARFRIVLNERQGLTGAPVNTLALSPDGRSVVFVGRAGGSGLQLYLRQLDALEAAPIPGTSGATFPAFSPDGHRVAYFGPGGFFVVPLSGGAPTAIANIQAQTLAQAVWLDDQSLVVTASDGSLSRLGLDGTISRIAEPDATKKETYLGVNAVLPDGHTILAIAAQGTGVNGTVVAIDVRDGSRTQVIEGTINAVWYSDGHLLWAQPTGALMGARFDLDELRVVGTPITLAQGVRQSVGGPAQVAVSATGSLVYIPEQPFNLMLLDHDGRREIIGEGRRFHNPRFSPDGSQLAMDFSQQGSRDVWSLDLRQKTLTRLTFENDGHDAIWSPDGRYLAYISRVGIFRRRADGSGVADSLYVANVPTGPLAFTPDGLTLITSPTNINGSFDIGLLSMGDERVEQPFIATPFNEQFVALSPDGRWMAYCSDETGRMEVYVRSFPEGGAKILVSLDGGTEPRWSPDGRQLYYIGAKDNAPYLISARVSTGSSFAVQDRTPLFDMSEFEPAAPHANWDVSPDGSRFAMVHQGALSEMVFVLNWTEEVRQR